MTRRPVLPACLAIGAGLACINGLCQAFVATPGPSGPAMSVRPASSSKSTKQSDFAGITCGMATSMAVAAVAFRASRVMVRANQGSPSLIQVLEQKKLLSTLENLRLLSAAENAGVKVDTVEELGLLTFAERLGLLSLAENVLTNGTTPFLMLAGSGVLGLLSLTVAGLSEGSFLQYFIAGALGAPALVLAVAALVILVVFGGARRTRDIDVAEKVVEYGPNGFKYSSGTQSRSLLESTDFLVHPDRGAETTAFFLGRESPSQLGWVPGESTFDAHRESPSVEHTGANWDPFPGGEPRGATLWRCSLRPRRLRNFGRGGVRRVHFAQRTAAGPAAGTAWVGSGHHWRGNWTGEASREE
eukprot:s526_g7.t1